jgi:exosortase/archaeosortase family protein
MIKGHSAFNHFNAAIRLATDYFYKLIGCIVMHLLNRYFDYLFFIKFTLLVLLLYFFSIAFNGIVSPEGKFYSHFLDHNLNYIAWLRNSILYVANFIVQAFGIQSYIYGSQTIKTGSGIEVEIWLPCLGLGIMSFWIAFVFTNNGSWNKKLIWGISGVFAIWFINCCRISIFIIALNRNWKENNFIDQHALFNIIAYTFIFMLMYFYSKDNHLKEVVLTD